MKKTGAWCFVESQVLGQNAGESQVESQVLGQKSQVKSQVLGAWSNRRCLVLGAWCLVLKTQVELQVLGAWCLVLGQKNRCLITSQILGDQGLSTNDEGRMFAIQRRSFSC